MQIYEQGKKAIVLIDEANMLQNARSRGVPCLLNLEVPGRKLVSIVLLGLPNSNSTWPSTAPPATRGGEVHPQS
jgi:type II secretory pathway predicted ATPase ExeA